MRKRMGAQGRGDANEPRGWARRPPCALLLLPCLALLVFSPAAEATFHEMSIREVYPGGADNASYVELQMWAGGQDLVGGHHLVAYNPDGSVNEDFALLSNVANGANQSTILVADSEYSVVFDEKPAPDESDAKLNLSAVGGAVCWIEGSPPDCVAWGDFTGPLPSHLPELKVGTPASSPGGVAAGKALRRSIAKGCSTLLDPPPTDDSDDSAADFSEVNPNPRDNATPPIEKACPPIPNTAIDKKPANPSKETAASFTYHAIPGTEATFECRLDGAAFASCPGAGIKYPGPLSEATHTFDVRAVNPTGTDATPASYTWTIDTTVVDETPPETTILSAPPNPSTSSTASFTYESSEGESSFECALDGGFAPCLAGGITYSGLGNGAHAFRVRAIDSSNNVDPDPASYSFTVMLAAPSPAAGPPVSSLLPLPSPEPAVRAETIVVAKPGARTADRTPTFRFRATAPGATFQCKLDGAPFRACRSPFTTKILGFGPHTLKIRALAGGVADPTPAVLRFRVERA
jgi:hypothetical protein